MRISLIAKIKALTPSGINSSNMDIVPSCFCFKHMKLKDSFYCDAYNKKVEESDCHNDDNPKFESVFE